MSTPDLDQLLDAMTLEEQASLLAGADFWTTVPVPRLGVPAIKVSDGPNGARGGQFKDGPKTACFPVGIALGATWNPALVSEAGAALAEEARLKGAQVLLAPTVNLHRTVLNGRNFECYSEDPHLSAETGLAYVRGVQGQGIAATIKHFVGNESEYQRMSISSEIGERALRELYLLPFERAVKEGGVMAVMAAYNRIDGVFACDHERLIQQVLREEWGFGGLVMSDWMALHSTAEGVRAGCDLEMPGPTSHRGAALVQAVEQGQLPAAAVRTCARRVLALIERVGAFRNPGIPAEQAVDLPAHRALIRRLGAEGAVLLKNDGDLLPLTPRPGQTLALIGLAAVEPQIMGGGSATVNAFYRVAPRDAIATQAGPQVRVVHEHGADMHRWVPVLQAPMALEFYNSTDFSGPVVSQQTSSSTEVLWIDTVDPAVNRQAFSARARLRHVAAEAGEYQFSLISAGRSRCFINGELRVDAWSDWRRGETYFTFGCEEMVATRTLQAGEVSEVLIEFSAEVPGSDPVPIHALRFGCHRMRGEADIVRAVEAARHADVAVVFAGLNAEWDNEGLDRKHMQLPHHQNELVARVAAVNPRTVVVLQTGAPVELPWLDQVSAVLQAWYPGQECGNAIADVLLGAAEPGGRLPQTWPLRLSDSPAQGEALRYPGVDGRVVYDEGVFIGYRHYEHHGITPRFPFGHGLSYTQFELSPPRLSRSAVQAGQPVDVEVTVRNAGARAGQVVVQLYVAPPASRLPRPRKELKAYAKLPLDAGQQGVVHLRLDMRALAYFDPARAAWIAEAGVYAVQVGRSAADLCGEASLELMQEWMQPVGS